MRLCFDSSALAKRYVLEPGTDRVVELCATADRIAVSVIAIPEIISGLNRLRREGILLRESYSQIKMDLVADVEQVTVVGVEAGVLGQAIRILETAPLRGMDALHVATAVIVGCDLFVTADRRQAEGARGAGLVVEYLSPKRKDAI